jgi:perosamine synthetase
MYSQRYQRNPVAEDIAWRGISLPSFPGLGDGEVREICERVHGFFAGQRTMSLVA